MRRRIALSAALALAGCVAPPNDPPRFGDCAVVRLWSNGWHTNFSLDAELLDADHPLRREFPAARHFLVGWGERDFYIDAAPGFWKGLKAIVPPSAAAMQVIAAPAPVEDSLWPGEEVLSFALSKAGARRLADEIGDALTFEGARGPAALGGGRVQGASVFYEARGNFHLFNMCNHWTARRLGEAGVPVAAFVSFTAPALMDAVRRKTPRECPVEGARVVRRAR